MYKRKRRLIAKLLLFFWEIGVAESNGDVWSLIESREIAVCTNLVKNSPARLARRGTASSCNALTTAAFSSCFCLSLIRQAYLIIFVNVFRRYL